MGLCDATFDTYVIVMSFYSHSLCQVFFSFANIQYVLTYGLESFNPFHDLSSFVFLHCLFIDSFLLVNFVSDLR